MPANFAMLVSSATLPLESGEMMYFCLQPRQARDRCPARNAGGASPG